MTWAAHQNPRVPRRPLLSKAAAAQLKEGHEVDTDGKKLKNLPSDFATGPGVMSHVKNLVERISGLTADNLFQSDLHRFKTTALYSTRRLTEIAQAQGSVHAVALQEAVDKLNEVLLQLI